MMLTSLHKQLLNDYQQDLPLSLTPYKDIADSLGTTEDKVISVLKELKDQQFIARIGSVIAPNHIGSSSLIAMTVPSEQLQKIAELVSQYPEVNHNYERENRFNLWFVLIATDDGHLQSVIKDIETRTGFTTLYLPLVADYYINLGFEIDFND
jgi:DNA-binding Lrp family transcriptional regulator